MQDLMREILRDLHSPPIFRYLRNGILSDDKLKFSNQVGEGITFVKLMKWMSPLMQELFRHINGANLFRPGENENAGFIFFDAQEILQEKVDLQDMFNDFLAVSDYDKDERKWLFGLVPIGAAFRSGDRYVADTFNRKADGEYPILLLRHELINGNVPSQTDVDEIASSYVDFFRKVLLSPLEYITRGWLEDNSGEHCYIQTVDVKQTALSFDDLKCDDFPARASIGTKNKAVLNFERVDVTLTELTKKSQQFAQPDQVVCLIAPLLKGELCIVRIIPPKGLRFCDVDIHWPWISSISLWAKGFSNADKKIIRQEQKASGWKSDDIYHDGPSFASRGQHLDFCVRSSDVEIPIDYIKLQIEIFQQPFTLNNIWIFEYTNIQGPEGELAKLVGDFEPLSDSKKLEHLIAVCRSLENGIPDLIQTNVRARLGLIGIFSVGPEYGTDQVLPIHVWRARLLRLLSWPGTVILARAALYTNKNCDAVVLGNEGEKISWRTELATFINEAEKKYPMIDHIYSPSEMSD